MASRREENLVREEACPICGSEWWTKTGAGYKICENGHQVDDFLEHHDDEEDLRFASQKTTRAAKEDVARASLVYTDAEVLDHLSAAYQLILRKQVKWLISKKGLPEELESLVNALWEQRLVAIHNRMDQTEFTVSYSADMDPESEGEAAPLGKVSTMPLSAPPTIPQTLSLLYLAIWILRAPVFLGDIIRWTNEESDGDPGLIHNAATLQLPKEILNRLERSTSLMQANKVIKGTRLQLISARLFAAYQKELGFVIPDLNLPVLLMRLIEELALPMQVYPAVKALARLLEIDFKYPDPFNLHYKRWVAFPQFKLAGLVVVIVKLFYPFDGRVRYPLSNDEPAVVVMDWDVWLQSGNNRKTKVAMEREMTFEEAQNIDENQILDMSEEQIDRYLDWFSKTWAEPEENARRYLRDEWAKELFATFPLEPRKDYSAQGPSWEELSWERMKLVQKKMTVQATVDLSEKEARKKGFELPGYSYRRYKSLEEMEPVAKAFHEAVSETVGISTKTLLDVTASLENMWRRWGIRERAASKAKHAMKDAGTENDDVDIDNWDEMEVSQG